MSKVYAQRDIAENNANGRGCKHVRRERYEKLTVRRVRAAAVQRKPLPKSVTLYFFPETVHTKWCKIHSFHYATVERDVEISNEVHGARANAKKTR